MKVNIFSDIYLEPFLEIKAKYIYNESYKFPEVKNELIFFIISDFFRQYNFHSIKKIQSIIDIYSNNNKVIVISDINFDSKILITLPSIDIYDLKIGFHAQMPFNSFGLKKIKETLNSYIRLYNQGPLKVIFVDLDNTLIPGVWEEDKLNIKKNYNKSINGDFHLLLRMLKKWYSFGCQIIVVSKNDKESVVEALNFIEKDWSNWITHIDHGWSSKSQRIFSLIKLLNISSDSCLFIDDNPIEIQSVKEKIDKINIIRFNNKFDSLFKNILNLGIDKLSNPSNIIERFKQYRNILKSNVVTKNISDKLDYDFKYYVNQNDHIDRIIELSSKTNQFNLCKNILFKIDKNKYDYISWDCKTQFGFLGIIGYAIIDYKNQEILNFVMSCRALGFDLEFKIFDLIMKNYSIKKIRYKKTDRNTVANNFLVKIEKKYEIKRIS